MFNSNQDNQSASDNTIMDHGTQAINDQSPSIGLGANPNNSSSLPTPSIAVPAPNPVNDNQQADSSQTQISEPDVSAPTPELKDIKIKALEELSPLVSKLDQTPEEKYKTIMMMIQASDNHELIKDAYEAASKITDEKIRAEALLNIVNEINYFTQKSES